MKCIKFMKVFFGFSYLVTIAQLATSNTKMFLLNYSISKWFKPPSKTN